MGMKIDNTCESKPMSREEIVENLKTMVFGVQAFERFNAKERGTLDKAWNLIDQYEARLKADMIAMLIELQLEIKELWDNRYDVWLDNQYYIGKSDTLGEVDEIIQQKINKLKGKQNETNN